MNFIDERVTKAASEAMPGLKVTGRHAMSIYGNLVISLDVQYHSTQIVDRKELENARSPEAVWKLTDDAIRAAIADLKAVLAKDFQWVKEAQDA